MKLNIDVDLGVKEGVILDRDKIWQSLSFNNGLEIYIPVLKFIFNLLRKNYLIIIEGYYWQTDILLWQDVQGGLF